MNIRKFWKINKASKLGIILLFVTIILLLVQGVGMFIPQYEHGINSNDITYKIEHYFIDNEYGKVYIVSLLALISVLVLDIVTNAKALKYLLYTLIFTGLVLVNLTIRFSTYSDKNITSIYEILWLSSIGLTLLSLIFTISGQTKLKSLESLDDEEAIEKLKQLKELLDGGIITEKEYNKKKSKYIKNL